MSVGENVACLVKHKLEFLVLLNSYTCLSGKNSGK